MYLAIGDRVLAMEKNFSDGVLVCEIIVCCESESHFSRLKGGCSDFITLYGF